MCSDPFTHILLPLCSMLNRKFSNFCFSPVIFERNHVYDIRVTNHGNWTSSVYSCYFYEMIGYSLGDCGTTYYQYCFDTEHCSYNAHYDLYGSSLPCPSWSWYDFYFANGYSYPYYWSQSSYPTMKLRMFLYM